MAKYNVGDASSKLDRNQIMLIVAANLCYLLDGTTHSIMGPLAPAFASEFGLSKSELGPIFSANLLGQTVGLLLVPLLQSRISHRWIIVWCTAAFGILEAATGLANSATHLAELRFLTGIGLGGALPSALALVAENIPPARRGTAVMILFFGYGIGQILSGAFASIFPNEHWRDALIFCGAVSLGYAVLAIRFLRYAKPARSQPQASRREHGLRTIFSAGMLPGTLALWLVFTSAFSVNYCLTSWLPTLLADIGYSPGTAAYAVSAFAFGGVLGTVLVGPIIDRYGSFQTVAMLFGLSGIFLLIDAAIISSAPVFFFLGLTAIAGFFVLGGLGGVNVALVDLYPNAARAIGAGWAKSVSRLGAILPPVLIGLALDRGLPEMAVIGLLSIPAFVATLAMLWLVHRYQTRYEPDGLRVEQPQ